MAVLNSYCWIWLYECIFHPPFITPLRYMHRLVCMEDVGTHVEDMKCRLIFLYIIYIQIERHRLKYIIRQMAISRQKELLVFMGMCGLSGCQKRSWGLKIYDGGTNLGLLSNVSYKDGVTLLLKYVPQRDYVRELWQKNGSVVVTLKRRLFVH